MQIYLLIYLRKLLNKYTLQGRPKPKADEARALGPQNILIFLKPNRPQNFVCIVLILNKGHNFINLWPVQLAMRVAHWEKVKGSKL
jgi:hypothetical protein